MAATFTAEPLGASLEFWIDELGLPVDVRFAEYGQVFQELLSPDSTMSRNRGGLNVVAVRLEDWSPDTDGIAKTLDDFVEAVGSAGGRLPAPLLIVLCPLESDSRANGARSRLRQELAARLASVTAVHLVDGDDLVAEYGVGAYDDPSTTDHGHVPYTQVFYAAVGTSIVRTLHALEAPPSKVLVLDCDQTLWSGVVGEDGPLGVVVDEPRRRLQEFALAQREAGMVLCLCTKNVEEDVLAVLEQHPDMILRREHIAAMRVNWEAKSDNLRSLAAELDVGLDSLVMLDDNPVECAEIRARCPDVVALALPDAAEIQGFLERLWVFDHLARTREDAQRARFYEEGAKREALRGASLTFADFIAGLELDVDVFSPEPEHVARLAQLTQRTNQFNNSTIRRTEHELRQDLDAGRLEGLAVDVRDRFGEYGLVGTALYTTRADALWVDSMLMSCRALGRGVEHRLLARVGEIAIERGAARVAVPFVPTARNQPALRFLEEVGAAPRSTEDGTIYELDAQAAAAVVFEPERTEARTPGDEPHLSPPSTATSPFRLDAEQLTGIAVDLCSADRIVDRIVSHRRRRPETSIEYTAPRTALEEMLAELWADTLLVDRVGAFDDFFELGGTSLQATLLVNRIQTTLGCSFDSIVLFDAPTLSALATLIERLPESTALAAPAIMARAGERRGPLSSAQQRLWFLDQFNPGSTVYNERRAIRLRGDLRVDALEQALEDLVARHESLRTTFPSVDGRAEQVVGRPPGSTLEIRDLSTAPARDREVAAARLVAAEAEQPFDLGAGPLFRAGLVRLDEDDHVLWLVFHHIVADGGSVAVLLRDLAAAYQVRLGLRAHQDALSVQYLDLSDWWRVRQGSELDGQRAYWRNRLADPPLLELPSDRPRPPILSYRGAAVPVHIPASLVARLRVVGQRRQATLFMTLMAAFDVLLARHSNQDDIVVGFPIANRNRPEAEGLVGFLVNTLALRVDLSGEPTFDEVIDRVRVRALEAYANQDVPFEQIVDELVPQRDLSRTPVFQAMLALLDDPIRQLELPGIDASPLVVPTTSARFDLVLNLEETPAGLRGALEYSTDLFDPTTAERLVEHLNVLLEGAATSSSADVLALPLLTEGERDELLGGLAGGTATFEVTTTLHARFEAQAARSPEAVALVFEGEALTYRELNIRANQLAHRLRRSGVGPDTLVGLCAERSTGLVVGILGILKAGGAYLPLDPTYPPDRLGVLLEDAGVSVVVAQETALRSLPEHAASVLLLEDEETEYESGENPSGDAGPENLAYVIYTSGSTGKPKGVPVTHTNVARLLDATDAWFGFGETDVWTLFHSFAFDFSVWELWGALAYGGRLVVVPYWVSRSPHSFHELLRTQQVTVLNQTPSAFRQLIEADRHSGVEPSSLALRYVIFGGEALDLQSVRPWFERHGDERTQLVNMYGITETTVHVTYRPITRDDVERGTGSVIGRPIPDLTLYVLNRALEPAPIGVAGEICVGGAGVARGYLHRPELTAERFVPDPFGPPGARLYRSGDLARRLPDGDIEYLGRIDNQVKIRGFRIELGEIEAAVRAAAPVRDSVVVAREDTPGDTRLVAYLVADDASLVEHLKESLRATLPEYMVPHHFVLLDSLPLTGNGKLDRAALPAPDPGRGVRSAPYVPPRTPLEETLVGIWADVLGVGQVGTDDNFFELGGDSILSIQVIARCRAAGLAVTPRDIFKTPTVAGLTRAVAPMAPAVSSEEGPPTGAMPLTPIQHWFFEQELTDLNHWNQSFALEVPPDVDVDLLETALHEVVLHHDAFRLRFRREPDGWRQEYGDAPTTTPVVRLDLSALPDAERNAALTTRAAKLQTQLDITHGPLVRALHADLGEGGPGRLVLAVHHLAVDGVSWRILLEDLESAYTSLRERKPIELPPRTTSYKRWAETIAAHRVDHAAVDWWQRQTDPRLASLPKDREGSTNLEADAQVVRVTLDAETTQALLQQVPAVYGTEINDTLLTALGFALSEWTGRSSFVIEVEGHGREDVSDAIDLSRTVGWFTTIYPVQLDATEADPGKALVATKERLRAIPDRGISYGLLRYFGDDETRSRLAAQPQPDLIFNYLGRFDRLGASNSLFRLARDGTGPWHSPRAVRRHAIEATALVRDGRLETEFSFAQIEHSTVARLADGFVTSLRTIVDHCTAAAERRFTPSDFPLAHLDRSALDRLLDAHPALEDVYPLTPMQQLFYAVDSTSSTVGVEEWRFAIDGAIEPDRLHDAWKLLVERHTILRTSFSTAAGPRPLQVVERSVEIPWRVEDLRGCAVDEREVRIRAILDQERAVGLDLDCAPLIRLVLVQLEDDRFELLWLTHHLYVDGWSWPIVLRELAALYRASTGDTTELPRACSYGEYITFLSALAQPSQEFWSEELAGFLEPTPVGLGLPGADPHGPTERAIVLTTDDTAELQALARRLRVTPSSIVQAAWALLLGHYAGADDIVFGAAFSGRPAELAGVEGLVGPCVNNVPVRARISGDAPMSALVTQLHEKQPDLTTHQYRPLEEIQACSAVPLHRRLFESLLVFQNYAADGSRPSLGTARMELLDGPDATNYPVTLVVVPGESFRFKLLWLPERLVESQAETMLRDLRSVLEAMCRNPGASAADVAAALPEETRGRAAAIAGERSRAAAAPYVPPGGTMEQTVAALWRELFEVERIGMDDNFFDLGGHSLLLVRAHERLVQRLGRDIPIATLLQNPTVRSLARHLSGESRPATGTEAKHRAERQRQAVARLRAAKGKR